jgi:tetratricopeptide (TPR) repeat protein
MKDTYKLLTVLLLISSIVSAVKQVNAKMIALYEFEGNAKDSTSVHNGTIEGAPAYLTGNFGQALSLDGLNDYIGINLPEKMSQMSIAMWVQFENIPALSSLISKSRWESEGNVHYNIFTSGMVELSLAPSGYEFSSITALSSGKWNHIVVICDGSENVVRFYINGDLVSEGRSEISRIKNSLLIGEASIGVWNDNVNGLQRFFKGQIDDVAIFNHALSEEEVLQLYKNSGASFLDPVLIEMTAAIDKAQDMITNNKAQHAVTFLLQKIAEFLEAETKIRNDNILIYQNLTSELHLLLARAKEAAGADYVDVVSTYKQVMSWPPGHSHFVPAFLWLFEHASENDYINLVRASFRKNHAKKYALYVAEPFELSGKWQAFEFFLNALFNEVEDPLPFAKNIALGLKPNGIWANKFLEYCRTKPSLTEHVIEADTVQAQKYEKGKEFNKAAEIYRNLINICEPHQDKAVYELKLYQCLFENAEHETVIHELNDFIKKNMTTHRLLVIEAMLLKARACIQTGQTERSIDILLTLTIEYPQSKHAPEAAYLVGYLYMLQGKFDLAKEALELVVVDYPKSSYAEKAQSNLKRINQMM